MKIPHRILTAVPRLPHVQLEIAKAIQTLFEQDGEDQRALARRRERETLREEFDLLEKYFREQFVRDVIADLEVELRRAGYDPNQPRVPAGSRDGGEWTRDGDGALSPATQQAANESPGIGHNQGPPLEEPPTIPRMQPPTAQQINNFLKAAAYWAAAASKARRAIFLAAVVAVKWLVDKYPYIKAYLDPPKTLEELQQNALNARPGYDVHHLVEQTPASDDGFSESQIEAPENKVSISTLKHWQITAWYATKNRNFGGMSPRDYLRGKSWEERLRVGKLALIRFKVLKP